MADLLFGALKCKAPFLDQMVDLAHLADVLRREAPVSLAFLWGLSTSNSFSQKRIREVDTSNIVATSLIE